jgi:hypothetical protein
VAVVLSGVPADVGARLLGDLRAGLSATRIDACERAPLERAKPLAIVFIAPAEAQPTTFSVDVTDSVTQKRIGRDLELADVPEDGRAFALAVATEELLRASWAELTVRRSQEPRPQEAPPPAPAEPPPAPGSQAPRDNHHGIGIRFSVEYYTAGHTELGPDVFFGIAAVRWLDVGLALGARRGLLVDAPDGSIAADALSAELFPEMTLVSGPHHQLDALLSVRGARVFFSATPDSGASGNDATGFTLYGRGGLVLSLGAGGFLRSRTRAGLGAPFKSFSASDGERVVTGVAELEVFASTGVAWEF